jgi:hypothetical protein
MRRFKVRHYNISYAFAGMGLKRRTVDRSPVKHTEEVRQKVDFYFPHISSWDVASSNG